MTNSIDIIGQKYGRLTVIRKADSGRERYVCQCDCGNTIILVPSRIKKRKSCGCYEKENLKIISHSAKTHGLTNTRIYSIWCGIKDRCNNPSFGHYDCYGGRGITICDEWSNSFEAFYEWAMQNGYADNLSIDRINVNGNYEPNNCRWATKTEQMRNRRDTVFVMYKGNKIPISEVSEKYGIYKAYIWRKVKAGYDDLSTILLMWEEKEKRKIK